MRWFEREKRTRLSHHAKRKSQRQIRSGLTLIELLAVIGILAVAAAALIPTGRAANDNSPEIVRHRLGDLLRRWSALGDGTVQCESASLMWTRASFSEAAMEKIVWKAPKDWAFQWQDSTGHEVTGFRLHHTESTTKQELHKYAQPMSVLATQESKQFSTTSHWLWLPLSQQLIPANRLGDAPLEDQP
jgi:prepilin-type N-terminal cleavage/methylation domain-containing protein